MAARLVLLIVCHLACAFFAGIETGVVSCGRIKLLHLSRNRDYRAKLLLRYLRSPERLFGTVLVGGNIASVAISTLAASLAYSLWGAAGLGVSSLFSTLTILVLCEFLPKAWFGANPVAHSLPFARLLRHTESMLLPLSHLATSITSLFFPATRKVPGALHAVTREHLRVLARSSEAAGEISKIENLMIGRALALQEQTARDIMVPTASTAVLSPSSTLADVARLAAESGHGKFPVLEAGSGKCLGVLHLSDVLARLAGNPDDPVMEFVRKPFYIRANMPADDILPKLRSHGQRIAIVRDKSVQMQGIVTIDAILSIIAGNLPHDGGHQ